MPLDAGWLERQFEREAVEGLRWPVWQLSATGRTFADQVQHVAEYARRSTAVRDGALQVAREYEAKARQIRDAVRGAAGVDDA